MWVCCVVGKVGEKSYSVVISRSARPLLLHLAQWFCFLCGLGLCSSGQRQIIKRREKERRGGGD